jgi:TM2 domain-containing membrane protein YozV
MVFCTGCGKEIHESAISCPQCGAMQRTVAAPPPVSSATDKRILPAFLLCFFVGYLGIHRFYVGKIGTGIFQLLTLGGLFIWAFVDLIMLACGVFTDGDGNKITAWT